MLINMRQTEKRVIVNISVPFCRLQLGFTFRGYSVWKVM